MTVFSPPERRKVIAELLTPIKEAFCLEYVTAGCTAMGLALQRAYAHIDPEAHKSKEPTPGWFRTQAYKMMRDPAVQSRIHEMRVQACSDARYTLMEHLQRLSHISVLAEAAGELKTSLAAEIARGKAAGYQRDDNAPLHAVRSTENPYDAQQPVNPKTGRPAPNHIQNAVIIQSMNPQDATAVYMRLINGQTVPEFEPQVITTIPATPEHPETLSFGIE